MDIRYQEFSPGTALQPYVDCYWAMQFNGPVAQLSPDQHCLPLGMLEMIFHLNDDRYEALIDGTRYELPSSFVAGMYDAPVSWKAVGGSRLFGIRIKPECLLELFRIPVSVMFGEFTDMHSFFGNSARTLTEQMRNAPGTGARIQAAEAFLLRHLRDRQSERNYVTEATRLIRQTAGNISLDDLSGQLYISPRQLQRTFKASIGTSPKTYMRIVRFASAYDYVQNERASLNWASLSYHFGYSDQAHLIRDFKQFAGKAPTGVVHAGQTFYQMTGRV
jgi:AraC-like DNA-binding protein